MPAVTCPGGCEREFADQRKDWGVHAYGGKVKKDGSLTKDILRTMCRDCHNSRKRDRDAKKAVEIAAEGKLCPDCGEHTTNWEGGKPKCRECVNSAKRKTLKDISSQVRPSRQRASAQSH